MAFRLMSRNCSISNFSCELVARHKDPVRADTNNVVLAKSQSEFTSGAIKHCWLP